jgi:hypothetical protein
MSWSRISKNPGLVQAIIEGVEEMHRLHAADGAFEGQDLIDWMNANRRAELAGIHDLYPGVDPETKGDLQIGRFLHNDLGQTKIEMVPSSRQIARPEGPGRSSQSKVSVWEISARTRDGLRDARERFLKDRPGLTETAADWIEQVSGSMKDYPEFERVLEFGRAYRQAGDPRARHGS